MYLVLVAIDLVYRVLIVLVHLATERSLGQFTQALKRI